MNEFKKCSVCLFVQNYTISNMSLTSIQNLLENWIIHFNNDDLSIMEKIVSWFSDR